MWMRSIFVFIFLSVWLFVYASFDAAAEQSTRLFILETSEAKIYKELTIENSVVIQVSSASRTSYEYNGYPNENLANIEMSHRSQSYNSRAGYRHYYSVLSDYVEEMLDIDYRIAGEYLESDEMINQLIGEGYIESSGTLHEDPLLTNGDLYLSGLIVLEYDTPTLFNRVEIDYIGENIFKMRSMMEPTLEYYGYSSVDEYIEVSKRHQEAVNGEGYFYSYYVDGEFLGETTEVKFYQMNVDEFFMQLYGFTEAEYFERYPNGADSVYHRVNDYINRGYTVTRHDDYTPVDFDLSEYYPEELYTDMAEEQMMEEDNALEVSIDEEVPIEEEEIDDADVADKIPSETPVPSLDVNLGHILSYQTEEDSLQLVHQNGTVTHGFLIKRKFIDDSVLPVIKEDAYRSHRFFDEVNGINTGYSVRDNVFETTVFLDYASFNLEEYYLPLASEFVPIYMNYRLADVHSHLLNEGYTFLINNTVGDSGTITLLDINESTTQEIIYLDGRVVDENEDESEDILEFLERIESLGFIVIDIK